MDEQHWWHNYPWRMVQTNFREIDMADIDAEQFARNLEDFGATVVMVNAGGILAGYPSRLPYHTVNRYLTGSSLKDILDACHRRNIRVIARMDFSKIPCPVYRQHPEWAFRTADGNIVEQNGFVQTCQNGVYQQEKAPEILKELLTAYPFDGVYRNMSGFVATDYRGNVYGFCNCEACRKGFWDETGLDIPTKPDMKDPLTRRYVSFQTDAGHRLVTKLNGVIKGISPEIAVDKVDFLRTESHTDIGEPIWVYSASSNARQTAGSRQRQICDNTSVDFMSVRYRESSVSRGMMELRQWQNLANGGNTSIYIMGRLDNHKDRSFFEGTRNVFQFHKAHEDLLMGLTSAAEVLLAVKALPSRFDSESYGWIRALTASHIPFAEAKIPELHADALKDKKVVILADVKSLTGKLAALFDAYVKEGGIVVVSGDLEDKDNSVVPECMGIKKLLDKKRNLMSTVFVVTPQDEEAFSRCRMTPVIAPGLEVTRAEYECNTIKYLHTLPEPMFGPPEVCYAREETDDPGLAVHPFGKGKGIFIPWNCGSFYHSEGYDNTLNFMQDVLFNFCGLPCLAPALHPSVELVLSKKENKKLISLINASGYFGNSFFEPIPMNNIVIELPGLYSRATALNGGNVTFGSINNKTYVTLDMLNNFEMIVMEAF